jgi:patatin-like phospholipase/acyl hydrolase
MRFIGKIVEGKIAFEKKDILEKAINKNNGKIIEMTISILDKPKHFLYKYLFGILYKSLSSHTGYTVDELHKLSKKQFAVKKVDSFENVPKNHKDKSLYLIDKRKDEVEYYYVQKARNMTSEELRDYIIKIEEHYLDYLDGGIDPSLSNDAIILRKAGMGIEITVDEQKLLEDKYGY